MPLINAAASAVAPYGGPHPVVYLPGRFIASYDTNIALGAAQSLTGWNVYVMPFEVRRTISINTLAVSVVTVFTGASTAGRIGVYNSRTSGEPLPGTVLVESGSMATWTTVGVKSASINQTLTPNLYWFAVQADNPTGGAVNGSNSQGSVRTTIGWTNVSNGVGVLSYSAASFGLPDLSSVSPASFTRLANTIIGAWANIASVP